MTKPKSPSPKPASHLSSIDFSQPLQDRPFRVYMVRQYLTQFDGSQTCQKLREEGAEHEWTGEEATCQKSATWWTQHTGPMESQKEFTYRETDPKVFVDPDLKTGEREGRNQFGQHWKEDW